MVFDRRKRASAKKEGSIELRITYNRKQRFVATGVRCLPKHWRNGSIVNCLDAYERQHTLDMFVTHARKVINEAMERGELDMDGIVAMVGGSQRKAATENVPTERMLVDYFRERAEIRKYGKAKDSQDRYDRFIRWFEAWGKMVTFADITQANVIAMDAALVERGMVEKSRWHNYHRFLNSFILDAIDEGLMRKNPYKSGINIKKVNDRDGLSRYLTKEEFERVAKVQPPTNFLTHARDLFVFQTYTCMAYVDLAAFDPACIRMVGGRPMYSARRGKTNQEFSFMVLKPAMEVLEKYGGTLPMMSNQKYNDCLKVLAVMAGINKPLSSHWARHTGATLLLNSGVDMEIVARILGHSSTKMTREVYAKLLDTTIADAMSRVEV